MVEQDLKVYAESFGAKLGANEIENAVQNLLKIKKDIISNNGNPPKEIIVICGLSNIAYKRPDGVYVVPITTLKN